MTSSPLTLDGWLQFNQAKWNVTPHRFQTEAIESVFYLNKNGMIYHPPRNPYLPVAFQAAANSPPHRVYQQWLEASEPLAQEMFRRRLANTLLLHPDVTDIRQWQWHGFKGGVRYTLYSDLPYDIASANQSVRRSVKKATHAGYCCKITKRMDEVERCLAETEARQGFSHRLSLADLELAQRLLGEEHLRTYVCYAPDGEPASASVVLHRPGAAAIAWLAGTRTAHLSAGAAKLVDSFAFDDLYASGATGFDLAGADIPGVAAAKAAWGARLMPCYTVEGFGPRKLAKFMRDWWRLSARGRKQA